MSPETIWGALSTAVALLFGLLLKAKNDRILELRHDLTSERACNDELTEKVEKLMLSRGGQRYSRDRDDRATRAKLDLDGLTSEVKL
jgi:hypothetical protein